MREFLWEGMGFLIKKFDGNGNESEWQW